MRGMMIVALGLVVGCPRDKQDDDDNDNATPTLRLEMQYGSPQSADPGTEFDTPLAVRVLDESGRTPSGLPVLFSAPDFEPTVSWDQGRSIVIFTNPSGVAMAPAPRAGGMSGCARVVASLHGQESTVEFALGVRNEPGRGMEVISGNNQTTRVGVAYALGFTVQVYTSLGRPAPGESIRFLVSETTPLPCMFPGDNAEFTGTTDACGQVTAPACIPGQSGSLRLTARAADGTETHFTLSVTS